MEQNASGVLPGPPSPKKKTNFLPLIIIVVILLSIFLSAGYFFYTRFNSSNFLAFSNANNSQNTETKIDSSWQEFVYEDASIKFSHPDNLSAVVINSGLSISMEGETVMNIKYDRLNSVSLSDYVTSVSDSSPEVIQLNQKTGLSAKVNNINYQYYPTYFDNYIVIETFEVSSEVKQTLDQMIQTIEFIAPSGAMRR